MHWSIDFISFEVISYTSLALGLSLVGVSPLKVYRKIIIVSVVTAAIYMLSEELMPMGFAFFTMYVWMLACIVFYMRLSLVHGVTATLLGMTYHLTFIMLLQYNMFDLILTSSNIEQDIVIQLIVLLFVLMNNILVIIFVFQKEPVLFQRTFFNIQDVQDDQSVPLYYPQLLFSILIVIVLDIFLYYTYLEKSLFTTSFRIFVTLWGIFMCVLILFFLRKALNHKMEQTQLFMDKQYQQDIQSFFSVIRSQRHDFNFHLNSIYGLIQNGKYSEGNAYIEEIVKNTQQINELLPLSHPATSALLNTLRELGQSKGIALHFYIYDDLKEMPCSIYDTNKILGNLIQNAIDEVETGNMEERDIQVEIAKEKDQVVIRVKNPTLLTDEEIAQMFQSGYSTKQKHEGVGLAGVEKIISRYRGIVFPELDKHTITMNVRIPILE